MTRIRLVLACGIISLTLMGTALFVRTLVASAAETRPSARGIEGFPPHALAASSVQTWTHDTLADWTQGETIWLDSTTVSGSLQLMQRLFSDSTTVTPRDDLGSGQTRPDVAVDGGGNLYAVWEDGRNGHTDIYFAYRSSGSPTWGASVKVNDDAGTAEQSVPAIAVDGAGNAYAVWQDERNGDADIYFAYRSAGGGWGANVKVNDDVGSAAQGIPSIVVGSTGEAYAAWDDTRNGNSDIYFAVRPIGGSWGANVRINDDAGQASQVDPGLALDGNGDVHAIWSDYRGNAYLIYAAVRPAGHGWGASAKVTDHTPIVGQSYPSIAADASGNTYAMWSEVVDVPPNLMAHAYFAYRPAGGDWGTNEQVSGGGRAWSPIINANPGGDAYAVWYEWGSGDTDIYFALRPAGGSWGPDVHINDDPNQAYQENPAAAVDDSGNAYAVWQDERNGNPDIYSSYRPAGGGWASNVQVNDDVSGRSSQDGPAIAATTSGGTFAAWQDSREGNDDIYFAYRPPGGSWGANVKINDDSGTAEQSSPAIDVDGNGNAYALWTDERNGGQSDIFFAYRPAAGSWGANAKVNKDTGGAWQWSPALAVDGDGNAYAAWLDLRASEADIYFAYRPAGGGWGANVRVNDTAGTAWKFIGPSIAVDTAGNVHVAWVDDRDGHPDIYAGFRAAGSTTWSADVKVSDDPGTAMQVGPSIDVDSSGNAYAAWYDSRNGHGDIYFAYRPAGGSWGTNVRVNDDPGTAEQRLPALVVDASGNAFAAWPDNRGASQDIYFATQPAGGTWGTNVQVNQDAGTTTQDSVDIAAYAGGNVHAVWYDGGYGTGRIQSAHSLGTSEYAPEGSYTSPGLDAGVTAASWGALSWQGAAPAGTSLSFETRSRLPGSEWSVWQALGAGSAIASPPAQYLQYRVTFSTDLASATPRLDQVQVTYSSVGTPSEPRFHTPCGVSNQSTPTLRGSAVAGSTVHLFVEGAETTTATAGTDGVFTFSPGLSPAPHALTATAENDAGIGPASAALSFTVDASLSYDPIHTRAGQWSKDGWLMTVPRDAAGCANPDNGWQIWPRQDEALRVEVPVSYTSSAAVTVTVGTATITLTEETTDLFAGVFAPPLDGGDFTIQVDADGETTLISGAVLIDPDGYVYESGGTISDTISGARVTCYYLDTHSAEWVAWDARNYGQVNPQTTLDDGYYSFYTPSGTYRVLVQRTRYTEYASPDLVVVDSPVRHNVPLVPWGWRIHLPLVFRNH